MQRVAPRLVACALCVAGPLAPAALAEPVSPIDLFLAPWTIPDDYYPTFSFTFGASSVVSQFITAADVGGTMLTGVHILPVLNPNPSPHSTEGEYTAADLHAITASNFPTYFFRKPDVDYTADLTPDAIRVDYRASGQYFVQVDAVGPGGTFTTLLHSHVDDFFSEDPAHGKKDKGGVSRKIDLPSADLIVVSDGDPDDNGAMTNAQATLTNEGKPFSKASTLAAVKKAIEDKYNAAGQKKISVVLVGHGFGPGNNSAQGGIKIGTEYITSIPGYMSPADFQKMIDKWVSSIEIWSCYTGGDKAFNDALAASIPTVRSFTTTVTWAAPSLFGLFSGYADEGAGGKKAVTTMPSSVPEPATVALLGGGLVVILVARWPRGRRARGGPFTVA